MMAVNLPVNDHPGRLNIIIVMLIALAMKTKIRHLFREAQSAIIYSVAGVTTKQE